MYLPYARLCVKDIDDSDDPFVSSLFPPSLDTICAGFVLSLVKVELHGKTDKRRIRCDYGKPPTQIISYVCTTYLRLSRVQIIREHTTVVVSSRQLKHITCDKVQLIKSSFKQCFSFQRTFPFPQDMYSTGQSPPRVDCNQDYLLGMATEEEGRTILHFERAANTGDAKDIQFTVIVLASLAEFYEESEK